MHKKNNSKARILREYKPVRIFGLTKRLVNKPYESLI